jgi:acetyl esterase/lipase
VVATYRWLLTTGARGAPVALAGDSAGGGLVLLLAQQARDAGLVPPTCVAALSPWTDLAGGGASVRENAGRDDMFHPSTIRDFAAAYLDGAAPSDPRASPLHGAAHALPPVLLHVGATELLLDDARAMHARLQAAGGTSRLEVYDGVAHAWHLLVPVMPEAVRAVDDVAEFPARAPRGRAGAERRLRPVVRAAALARRQRMQCPGPSAPRSGMGRQRSRTRAESSCAARRRASGTRATSSVWMSRSRST